METKVILSTAWAERLKFADQDLAKLFDFELAAARPSSEKYGCPTCENEPDDSNYRFFVYEPAESLDTIRGLQYIGCVCGAVYYFRITHYRGVVP